MKEKLLLLSWLASIVVVASISIPFIEPKLASIIYHSLWGKVFFGLLILMTLYLQVNCIISHRKISKNKVQFWLLVLIAFYTPVYFYRVYIKSMMM